MNRAGVGRVSSFCLRFRGVAWRDSPAKRAGVELNGVISRTPARQALTQQASGIDAAGSNPRWSGGILILIPNPLLNFFRMFGVAE